MKYTRSPARSIMSRFLYVVAALFLCADLVHTFMSGTQYVYCVLALCAYTLGTQPTYLRIAYLLFLVSLETWLLNGYFGISLIFLLPLAISMVYVQPKLYSSRLVIGALALAIMAGQCVLVEGILLWQWHTPFFTIAQIAGNLLLTMSISLI